MATEQPWTTATVIENGLKTSGIKIKTEESLLEPSIKAVFVD